MLGHQHERHIREQAIRNAGESSLNQAHGYALSKADDYETAQSVGNRRTPWTLFKTQIKDIFDNHYRLVPTGLIESNIELNRQRANLTRLRAGGERFRDEWMKLCALGKGLRLSGMREKKRREWLSLSESEMAELDEYLTRSFGGVRALEFASVDMSHESRPRAGWASDVLRRHRHGFKTKLRPS